MKRILLTCVLLLAASAVWAQGWARARLDKSPRHREWVTVKHDNRAVETFVVYPESKSKTPVVLLIHEIFGMTDWVQDLADQVAEAGYIAVAPDLLSGMGPNGGRSSDFPEGKAMEAVSHLSPGQITADLNAVADYALKLPAASGKLFVAGFCWGGGQSFRFATQRGDLAAAFVFYGPPPDKDAMARIKAPVYGFYGGNDARIDATIPETRDAMKAAGKTYKPVVYEGAGHGFMRAGEAPDANDANRKARNDAWARWKGLLASAVSLAAVQMAGEAGPPSLVARVRDTGFIQVTADSFNTLSLDQRMDAYWLTQAAIAIDPIAYDQNSVYGLREKHLLEAVLTHPNGISPAVLKKITDYTMLFWGNRGNHNAFTSLKFVPDFTPAELKAAAGRALQNGAKLGTAASLHEELKDLEKPIFDPNFQPMLTNKNPPDGEDPLEASANNYYSGVRLKDLAGFTGHYALNSRLVKKDGKLVEEVYRAGTPDGSIPPGLYAHNLGLAIKDLHQALPYASEQQKKVINALIRYYQTGDRADWIQCGIDWVQDKTDPDFSNGFVEVYEDARGQKGAIQGFVTVVDEGLNKLMAGFAANAAYFEQRAPWDARYKNPNPSPPIVNAVETLVETGDFDVTTIGDNLPNENEIHEKYGSKSFIFTGSMRALNSATGQKVAEEFASSQAEIGRARKYGDLAESLMTAMHEVIGHGSGRMNPKLTREPASYLKEYYSTLEETRADLMALWSFWDPKLLEMHVMPGYDVAKAAYENEARAALTQLREVPSGDTIEEDHRRGTQLIVNYIRDKTGAIQPIERDGKVYMLVTDYQKMRQGVGMLLAELMRIKAEGDYDAAKALITKYGIHFNTAWRDQVIARYKTLDLPTYWVGINSDLELHMGANGQADGVEISYPRDIVQQQLRYAQITEE